jgi:hypothetical protein
MAKMKVPFAGKEKRKTSNGKLPVPPPKPAQQAASAAPEDKKATPAPRGSVALASKDFAGDLAIAARESAVDQGVLKPSKEKPKAKVWVDGVQVAGDPGPVPESLKVENRKPLSKKAQAELDKKMAAAKTQSTDTRQAELRAAQKAHKAEVAAVKRNAKKEKEAAVAKGATTAMPAQGKDALKVIAGKSPVAIAKKGETTRLKAREAARKRNGVTTTGKKPGKKKPGKGSEIVLTMLKRKQGATRAELCEATGWAGVSVPGFARRAKLKLIKEKRDGVTCYRV